MMPADRELSNWLFYMVFYRYRESFTIADRDKNPLYFAKCSSKCETGGALWTTLGVAARIPFTTSLFNKGIKRDDKILANT